MKFLTTLLGLLCATQLVFTQPQNPCANLPGGTGFANDYSSCDGYFSCIRGKAHPAKCPLPFLFNPNGRFGPVCDWPFNVNCLECPTEGILTIGHPYICQKYTQCINGIAIEKDCAPGTAYSREKGTCVVEVAEICAEVNTCGRLEGGSGHAPSTRFCEDYVVCFNGDAIGEPVRCAAGMKFDSKNMRCALSADAECYPGSISAASFNLGSIDLLH